MAMHDSRALKTSRRLAYAAFGIAAALAVAGSAESRGKIYAGAGQRLVEARQRSLDPQPASPNPEAPLAPKWGIRSLEVINIHAHEFQASRSSDLVLDDGHGYRYFGAPSVPFMAAPVRVPPGAQISAINISYCARAEGDLSYGLFDNGVGGSGRGGGSLIVSSPVLPAGCGTALESFGPYDYTAAADHRLYLVVFFAGNAFDGTTKFNNVTIGFVRSVSPPPATARFDDVPVTGPAAMFLARALGPHSLL